MAETKQKSKKARNIIIAVLAGIVLVLCGLCKITGGNDDKAADTPTDVPAQEVTQEVEHATEMPTDAPEPEGTGRTMYICGYDRCQDSGTYSELVLETGINVWSGHDPDRGMAHHQVAHGDEVTIISEVRVEDGPGGLWYELEGGGWISDLWLTDKVCTPDNLEEYSLTTCW